MKRSLPIVLVALCAVSVTILIASGQRSERAVSSRSDGGRQDEHSHPLDRYPGFGRSPEAALRDDSIALWEAYEREREIVDCMQRAGHAYEPDPAFPEEEILDVAHFLDVPDADGDAGPAPGEANARLRAALSEEQLDDYYLALYGESASAVRAYEESDGQAGPEDLGSKGCVGEAGEGRSSIWDARRSVEGQLHELNLTIALRIGPEYSECAAPIVGRSVSGPSEIEDALMAPDLLADEHLRLSRALAECDGAWRDLFVQEEVPLFEEFVGRNSELLSAVEEHYATSLAELRSDDEFREFLAHRAQAVRSAVTAARERISGAEECTSPEAGC